MEEAPWHVLVFCEEALRLSDGRGELLAHTPEEQAPDPALAEAAGCTLAAPNTQRATTLVSASSRCNHTAMLSPRDTSPSCKPGPRGSPVHGEAQAQNGCMHLGA